MIVVFAILSLASSGLIFDTWKAETSIVVEDPGSARVFDDPSFAQPERYLASQIAILESADFAEAVRSTVDAEADLTTVEILRGRDISSRPGADVLTVSFAYDDPDTAVTYANAYGRAYAEYREDLTINTFSAAVDSLDRSIAEIDRQIATIEEELAAGDTVENRADLEEGLQDAINNYLSSPPSDQSAAALENVLDQLQTLEMLRSLETQDPSQVQLLESMRSNIERRSQLIVRKDQLEVDAVLASPGIVATSEAMEAARSPGTTRVLLLGVVLGFLVGLALAYYLAMRNRRFTLRTEPESILQLPLLADVPRFADTAQEGRLPVTRDPSSPAAEAFRFASNAIFARLGRLGIGDHSPGAVIVVTSALVGDGKTTVTSNLGMAMAGRGKSVLLIDADFGDSALSSLLVGDDPARQGITNVLAGDARVGDVVVSIDVDAGHQVDVLTRGNIEVAGGDFFNSQPAAEFFDQIRTKYDVILVDAPPLLQVSYATDVVGLGDVAVVVIPHEGRVSVHRDVQNRLDLIGVDRLGYVYNQAPKRPELFDRSGSMRDPLGSGQLANQ